MDRTRDREKEGEREWETKEDVQGGEGAAIKAKAGKAETQRSEERKRENNKHENAVHVPNDRFNNHKNHKKQRSRVEWMNKWITPGMTEPTARHDGLMPPTSDSCPTSSSSSSWMLLLPPLLLVGLAGPCAALLHMIKIYLDQIEKNETSGNNKLVQQRVIREGGGGM